MRMLTTCAMLLERLMLNVRERQALAVNHMKIKGVNIGSSTTGPQTDTNCNLFQHGSMAGFRPSV